MATPSANTVPTPRVGIVGCGSISDTYCEADDAFDAFDVVACSDLDVARARETATAYDVPWAGTPEDLFTRAQIDLVVNLTPPHAHEEVIRSALQAGKHVYTEKPLATTASVASSLLELAEERGCLLGTAPDTFLGGSLQTARRAIDEGRIGEPISATAFWVSGGHESWHPSPEIFYQPGGGPSFDMGPYYVSALAHLLGPVDRVAGSTRRPREERTVPNESGTAGTIPVDVPTTEAGIVDFACGATATMFLSFDVPDSEIAPQNGFEIHGTEGTLSCPDPNHFEGAVRLERTDSEDWEVLESESTHVPQRRGLGILDTVTAMQDEEWSHRTSGAFGLHVLEVLEGIRTAGREGRYVEPATQIDRPEPVSDWYESV
jgi:predicted dehydrogenase